MRCATKRKKPNAPKEIPNRITAIGDYNSIQSGFTANSTSNTRVALGGITTSTSTTVAMCDGIVNLAYCNIWIPSSILHLTCLFEINSFMFIAGIKNEYLCSTTLPSCLSQL
jgi:hypothetical protein